MKKPPFQALSLDTRSVPGEEDTLHHVEVLHEDIPLWFGAQAPHGVSNA